MATHNRDMAVASDKRMHPREAAVPHAYVGLGPGLTWLGAMQDISAGGACFEYVARGPRPANAPTVAALFVTNQECHLSEIPCTIVYDIPAGPEAAERGLPAGYTPRRCGVQFTELGLQQRQQLESLISICAAAAVPERVVI
jgi:hypothetical protein